MIIRLEEDQWKTLTDAEKSVITYINNNEELIPEKSISEMAEESYTSPATVSRTIRKSGFDGISELRYRISARNEFNQEAMIVNAIFQKSMLECQKTIENLKVPTILEVVKRIKRAKKIYLLARGATVLVAEEFEMQLQLLGNNVWIMRDSEHMKRSNLIFKEDDLVIIFTVKNSTPELGMAAKFAKENKAYVVSCTCLPRSELNQYSDVYVVGYTKYDYAIKEFLVTSRLPLQIISRTIIEYLTL